MAKPTQPLAPKAPHAQLSSRSPDLGRHARKCAICNHPEREAIEDEFLRWCKPAQIVRDYKLPCLSSIYHHAHATGLLARRFYFPGDAGMMPAHFSTRLQSAAGKRACPSPRRIRRSFILLSSGPASASFRPFRKPGLCT